MNFNPSKGRDPNYSPRVSIDLAKDRMRTCALQNLRNIQKNYDDYEPAYVSRVLRENFLNNFSFTAGSIIAGYWPKESEINILPLLSGLAERGCTLCMPVIIHRQSPLRFRLWEPGAQMIPGRFGLPMPPETSPEVQPTHLIVPLIAFDRFGYRLGRGQGYYDRTLGMLRAQSRIIAIGVCYDGQELSAVPHDVYDQRLDWVVTEKRALYLADGVDPQKVFSILNMKEQTV